MKKAFLPIVIFFLSVYILHPQPGYYFPGSSSFDPSIPTPEQFLGYQVGDHHTRYDLMVEYLRKLSETSPRATLEYFGETVEKRAQVILTVSSERNLNSLEQIRQAHLKLADPAATNIDYGSLPLIIQLGFNVHGNEASGGEASLLAAYYLVACTDPEVTEILERSVIFIEPVLNPDGRDRFTTWANMNRGNPPVADPIDREHTEAWPGGRTNHYWFDLNRDWLPLTQQESRNRVVRFHRWLPNIVTDHHEMGTSNSFFFEPTKKGSENQIITMENYRDLNNLFAEEYSRALDGIAHYYDSGDSFDNSYPGYGSTYADVHGGLAVLFEQASSRGLIQKTDLGYDMEFRLGIRNQLFGALTTVRTAVRERSRLNEYMHRFFTDAMKEAASDPVKAYLFGDSRDAGKNRAFIDLLNRHNIEVYNLRKEVTVNGRLFSPGESYLVPTQQRQYKMVRTIFEPVTEFADSLFYDASAWAMVFAYGIPFAGSAKAILPGERVSPAGEGTRRIESSEIAYIFEWSDLNSPKALWQLMESGLRVKCAWKPFTIETDGGSREFGRGSIVVPVPYQELDPGAVYEAVVKASALSGVNFYSAGTSRSKEGPWLGSGSMVSIEKPSVLLLTGDGVSSSVAGEVWYSFDTMLGMPLAKIDGSRFGRARLSNYSVIILPSGVPSSFGEREAGEIDRWVRNGGTLIAIGSSVGWLNSNKLVNLEIESRLREEGGIRTDYDISRLESGKNSIGGIYCRVDLDITHPLGFGYNDRSQVVYRNSAMTVGQVEDATSNVAVYTDSPMVSGFITPGNLERIKGSASVITQGLGQGKIIVFVDDPLFRGHWVGTARMLFNAVFLGQGI